MSTEKAEQISTEPGFLLSQDEQGAVICGEIDSHLQHATWGFETKLGSRANTCVSGSTEAPASSIAYTLRVLTMRQLQPRKRRPAPGSRSNQNCLNLSFGMARNLESEQQILQRSARNGSDFFDPVCGSGLYGGIS